MDVKLVFSGGLSFPSGVNRGVRQVTLDGKVLPGDEILLPDDSGQHQVQVLMG